MSNKFTCVFGIVTSILYCILVAAFIFLIQAVSTLFYVIKEIQAVAKERIIEEEYQNKEDICYLSSIITAECRTCTTEEKFLIGSVVLNRSKVRNLKIEEVLFENKQFGGTTTHQFHPTVENDAVASKLIQGKGRNKDYLYFFTGEPCWSLGLVNAKKENWHHTFSY